MNSKSVCVLGNGQLGRMLKQAGEPLGIAIYPVGIDQDPTSIPYENSVITAEIERWADTPFTKILANHPHFINRDVFPIIADRLTQKQLLDELNLPTAKWQPLTSLEDWRDLFDELGDRLIVKRRTGGYDGRGQWRITYTEVNTIPDEIYQQAIIEEFVPFKGEVSLVGARNVHGETQFYPITHNLQQNGILKMSVVFPQGNSSLQQEAETMLSKIMHKLDYVGVMAMECFVVDNQLIINELAPRVHNSGHWTQNGASISQFELHLRAILDLPMPKPSVISPSVMVNLIGIPLNYDWLSNPLTHLHWYEKEVRAGRKVGHLNLTHHDINQLIVALDAVTLPKEEYEDAIKWAKTVLSNH